ncbi:ROK family protein [Hufsiella ginkgonis]|uniref:ROK family protein n=1 Tax=Hufsiella ginkgonis TaxID=2695274 RepID=A0A7K1XZI8_9SPHI|nr:ROK family protein [Hufsiella ginkgonis]MXV16383.1 ROK family protein [Hufsiella ginkgonis]
MTSSPDTYLLTADIGGSHITTGICSLHGSTVLKQSISRVEVLSNGSASHILRSWARCMEQSMVAADGPVIALGVAMPGPFDYENGVSLIKGLNKYEALYGMNIKSYFAGITGLPPERIRFRNDAEATIAGEVFAGAGRGFKNVLGITLGTGFGSAHLVNGQALDLNLGSERFRTGIADDHLSTRWFMKRYADLTGFSLQGVKELAELAATNRIAKKLFYEFAANMSEFLTPVIQKLDPEVLLICGNIAKANRHFLLPLTHSLSPLEIRIAEMGEIAAMIGATGLFKAQEIADRV